MMKRSAIAATLALSLGSAHAATNMLDLSHHSVSGNYALDTLNDMGLEAYPRNRGSLLFVGGEGMGVVEISLTG